MKNLKSILCKSTVIFLIFTLLCGVLYTGLVTGAAQLLFPHQANGSILEIDGKSMAASCLASSTRTTAICGGVL